MHSEWHRNFVLLVTRKIWLRQCHRNNLSSVFFSLYCLVWMLSFHPGMDLLVVRFAAPVSTRIQCKYIRHNFNAYFIFIFHSILCANRIGFRLDLIVWYIVWTGMWYLHWFQDVFADEIQFDYNFIFLLLLFDGVAHLCFFDFFLFIPIPLDVQRLYFVCHLIGCHLRAHS